MDRRKTYKALVLLIFSAVMVSIYGILEHFGIDKDIWVQDVQTRVFSTLGQPNWLAAWLVSLIFVPWSFLIAIFQDKDIYAGKNNFLKTLLNNKIFWLVVYALYFLTLIYTKSRSGFVGFVSASLVFWAILGWMSIIRNLTLRSYLKTFTFFVLSTFIIMLSSGTPWTGSLFDNLKNSPKQQSIRPKTITDQDVQVSPQSPQLEVDSFSSTEIRKIVWDGSIDIWKNYPILGTGVETFAYSYYNFRPVEHNLVSEWDFLYNKAHNEYLNFAATTGTLGLGTYMLFILTVLVLLIFRSVANNHWLTKIVNKFKKQKPKEDKLENDDLITKYISVSLLSGFFSILVTNFFGFSVVPVALMFFLFPAFAISLGNDRPKNIEESPNQGQIVSSVVVLLSAIYILFQVFQYWRADLLFAKGRAYNDVANYVKAREYLTKAIQKSPNEAVFWEELAQSSMGIAISLYESDNQLYTQFVDSAVSESEKSLELSPSSVNAHRKYASILLNLSPLNDRFLERAVEVLENSIELAPTEAKLSYNLGLTYLRMNEYDNAEKILVKTIEMKPNYTKARVGYAILLNETGRKQEAINELNFILENIDPDNKMATQQLEEIKNN